MAKKPQTTERQCAIDAAVLAIVRQHGPIGSCDIHYALLRLHICGHIRRIGNAQPARYESNEEEESHGN